MSAEAWLAGLALVLSVGTIASQARLARASYLACELTVEYPQPGTVNLLVKVGNSSARTKRMGPVFLLLGPVAENPITTFNRLLAPDGRPVACCAIDFESRALSPIVDPVMPLRQLIPLTYFTEENDDIGDETLAFTYPLQLPHMDTAQAISARLYVYGHSRLRTRLHRKVQSVILVGQAKPDDVDVYQLKNAESPACRAACRKLKGCSQR